MLAAEAALKTSSGKVSGYHEDYAVKSKAVGECKPDAVGSTCTIDLKNQLALKMMEAGKLMIDNDNANQRN